MDSEVSFKHLKALIVEDSNIALLDIRSKLSILIPEENIFIAQDYWQAVKLLESQDFHVAFVDLHMPEKTGMDLIVDFIYANPRTSNLPVVVTTGLSPQSLVTHSLQKYAYRYLFKPVALEAIREALANLPLKRE